MVDLGRKTCRFLGLVRSSEKHALSFYGYKIHKHRGTKTTTIIKIKITISSFSSPPAAALHPQAHQTLTPTPIPSPTPHLSLYPHPLPHKPTKQPPQRPPQPHAVPRLPRLLDCHAGKAETAEEGAGGLPVGVHEGWGFGTGVRIALCGGSIRLQRVSRSKGRSVSQ
jgi:hypothetical protein